MQFDAWGGVTDWGGIVGYTGVECEEYVEDYDYVAVSVGYGEGFVEGVCGEGGMETFDG